MKSIYSQLHSNFQRPDRIASQTVERTHTTVTPKTPTHQTPPPSCFGDRARAVMYQRNALLARVARAMRVCDAAAASCRRRQIVKPICNLIIVGGPVHSLVRRWLLFRFRPTQHPTTYIYNYAPSAAIFYWYTLPIAFLAVVRRPR